MTHEIKIEQSIDNCYCVFVWRNQWHTISKHRYKSDAEEVRHKIEGEGIAAAKQYINDKMDCRINTVLAPYYVN